MEDDDPTFKPDFDEDSIKKEEKKPKKNRDFKWFMKQMKALWRTWAEFNGIQRTNTRKKRTERVYEGVPGFEELSSIEEGVPDIMTTDLDKVRTSCKEAIDNPPIFPTKDQIKAKLEAADRYYQVEQSGEIERLGSDGEMVRPTWHYILDRPIVEQYVLMTNYIRKLSALSDRIPVRDFEVREDHKEVQRTNAEYKSYEDQHIKDTRKLMSGIKTTRKKLAMQNRAIERATYDDEKEDAQSETSVYPNSELSKISEPSKRYSLMTIAPSVEHTGASLSSPVPSDFDQESVRSKVKNKIRWWESKDGPPMSETIPTSDSMMKMTSESTTDDLLVPLHSVVAQTDLPVDFRKKTATTQPRRQLEAEAPKKVKFCKEVTYFKGPEKTGALYRIPTESDEAKSNEGKPRPPPPPPAPIKIKKDVGINTNFRIFNTKLAGKSSKLPSTNLADPSDKNQGSLKRLQSNYFPQATYEDLGNSSSTSTERYPLKECPAVFFDKTISSLLPQTKPDEPVKSDVNKKIVKTDVPTAMAICSDAPPVVFKQVSPEEEISSQPVLVETDGILFSETSTQANLPSSDLKNVSLATSFEATQVTGEKTISSANVDNPSESTARSIDQLKNIFEKSAENNPPP